MSYKNISFFNMKKNEIEKKYYVFFRATDNGQQF